jgi:hypothetical protein
MPLTNRMIEYKKLIKKHNQYKKELVNIEEKLKYSKKLKHANKINNNIVVQLNQLQYYYNKKIKNIKNQLGV